MLVSISATNCDEAYHIVDCASFPIESLALRWHFITSVVSTEKYNVNSILCQCTMVVIAKCQIFDELCYVIDRNSAHLIAKNSQTGSKTLKSDRPYVRSTRRLFSHQ